MDKRMDRWRTNCDGNSSLEPLAQMN